MTPKEKILADLSRTRSAITRDTSALKEEMNVVNKANRIVRRNPLAWISGAAVFGWLLAGPKTRTRTRTITRTAKPGQKASSIEKKTAKRTGMLALLLGLVRFLFPLMKPALSRYATQMIADAAGKLSR